MATLDAVADDSVAKVSLTLEWSGVDDATIVRVDPDGSRVPVRNAEPATVIAGAWTGDDYEAPLDVAVTYEATSADAPGTLVLSGAVTVASGGKGWLKHLGLPILNQKVVIAAAPTRKYAIEQGVFAVPGRLHPIVTSTTRRSASSDSIAFRTATEAEAAALRALCADGTPLLLQVPSDQRLGTSYVALGELTEAPTIRPLADDNLVFSAPYVTVDRPPGAAGGSAGATWNDVTAYYATWSAVLAGVEVSPSWTLTALRDTHAIVVGYSGVDTSAPIEASAYATRSGTSADIVAPSVTTLGANRMIALLEGEKSSGPATSITDPASTTRRQAGFGSGSPSDSALCVDFVQVSAGATPTKTATWDTSSANGVVGTFALKPSGTIAYRDSAKVFNNATSKSTTLPLPAGLQSGDFMLAIFVTPDTVAGAQLTAEPVGWTKQRVHTSNGTMSSAYYSKTFVGPSWAGLLDGVP